MKDVTMIMDLQFGSTGKGLISGYLAHHTSPDTVVAAWGPNAGHTYVDSRGVRYITTMLPIGAISSKGCKAILIGPGATVDLKALLAETQFMVANHEGPAREMTMVIHPQAMVVLDRHRQAEAAGTNVKIGSTMKGAGAALVEKVQRNPAVSPLIRDQQDSEDLVELKFRLGRFGITVHIDEAAYYDFLASSTHMQVEGAQGFGLGVHREFWPYATSREVTPAQILSDCGMPVPKSMYTVGTLRTYPIRVANRFDKDGQQIGTSGPVYSDQRELDWSEVGVDPEYTTVTKLQRRIFTMSFQQLHEAVRVCRPQGLFLNFANYVKGKGELEGLVSDVEYVACTAVKWLGYGPAIGDVVRSDKPLR